MTDYSALIGAAEQQQGLPAGVLHGLLQTESSMNPKAVGPDTKWGKAQGIAQLIPDTAKRLGVSDPFDPQQAIPAAAALVKENLDRYGNIDDALRAYHGGTDKANWGPKTQAYVEKVKSNMPTPDYKPDNDPMWDIMAGKSPAPKAAPEIYKPDSDPMWDIMAGTTPVAAASPVAPAVPAKPEAPSAKAEEGKGFLQNLKDVSTATTHHISNALLGLTQLGAHAISPESQFTNRLDAALAKREADYQQEIAGGGWGSWAGAALGEVSNPTNALLALRGVASIASPLARGMTMGGVAGAAQPVTEGGNFAGQKALQVATGAAVGGAAEKYVAPAVGSVLSKLTGGRTKAPQAAASMTPEEAKIEMANLERAKDAGQMPIEEANARMEELASGILGRKPLPKKQAEVSVPVENMSREQEFAALGIQPTKGQLTRDPTQFAFERNARATSPEVAQRFLEQDQALRNKLMGLGAANAQEPYAAGNMLIAKLTSADAPVKASVSAAYDVARNAAGKDTIIPTDSALARFNLVKDEFGEELIPTPIKSRLQAIADGESPYTIDTAEKLLKVINRNYKPNALDSRGQQQAAALDELRKGIKGSLDELTANDVGAEAASAFADARAKAAMRFRMIEDTPALKAVLNEQATPDTFVNKFIINGDTAGLKSLRRIVDKDPEAQQIVRSQVAEYLRSKGFGVDMAGDNQFAQAAYNRAIKALGEEKLSAFFSPKEVETLKLIGKVGSYIHAQPAGSAINNSNTAGVLMGMLDKIISVVPAGHGIKTGVKEIGYAKQIKQSLNPQQEKPAYNTAAALRGLVSNE